MLYLNVSNWSLFFTALCATILLFFLPATRCYTRVSSRGSFQRSGVFVIASWLNGTLLFACIHGDSRTMAVKVPELLLGLRGDQRCLIRTLPQLQLFTRSCLHSCVSGFSSCAICTSPSLSHSPCSFVASDLSALTSLLTHFFGFALLGLCATFGDFFLDALNDSLNMCWLFSKASRSTASHCLAAFWHTAADCCLMWNIVCKHKRDSWFTRVCTHKRTLFFLPCAEFRDMAECT